MFAKIPLPFVAAGVFAIAAFSAAWGKKTQKKFYQNLFEISYTSNNEMARALANRIIFEDLRIKLEPIPEDN